MKIMENVIRWKALFEVIVVTILHPTHILVIIKIKSKVEDHYIHIQTLYI